MFPVNRFLFRKNVGIFIATSNGANKSWTLNPLSDIIESPGSQIVNKFDLSTIYRSLVEPPKAGEIYDINPPGDAPTKVFTVFLFLYVEKVDC